MREPGFKLITEEEEEPTQHLPSYFLSLSLSLSLSKWALQTSLCSFSSFNDQCCYTRSFPNTHIRAKYTFLKTFSRKKAVSNIWPNSDILRSAFFSIQSGKKEKRFFFRFAKKEAKKAESGVSSFSSSFFGGNLEKWRRIHD